METPRLSVIEDAATPVAVVEQVLLLNRMPDEASLLSSSADPLRLTLFGEGSTLDLDSLVVTEIVIHLADKVGVDLAQFEFSPQNNTIEKLVSSLERLKNGEYE